VRRLALLAIASFACGGRGAEEQPGGVEKPVTSGGKSSVDDDGGRWLFLEQHQDSAARASYLAFDLEKAAAVPLGDAPAMPDDNWPGHFRTVATGAGSRLVRAESGGKLVLSDATGCAEKTIELGGAQPTALHLVGDRLFVGFGPAVGWIDLAAARPSLVRLVERDHKFKAYDLFARSGDRLVAIDDQVMPMYADFFALEKAGPRRLADWELPGVINGHYDLAALVPGKPNEWTLYLVAPYGIMDGNGQDLAAVPVRGDKLVFEEGLTLQNGRDSATPILEEHVDRATDKPTNLAAGTEFTYWTGLAVDRDRLLLAAGKRGLLVLPGDFDSKSKGQLVDLGGECRDVRASGGVLVALIGSDKGAELVILSRAGQSYQAGARHPLPAAFDRILD
jgi:hypothetical protein